MRISDWSSDVCSSDLVCTIIPNLLDYPGPAAHHDIMGIGRAGQSRRAEEFDRLRGPDQTSRQTEQARFGGWQRIAAQSKTDRKGVVEGKRVSVRVDLGGGRILKKKKMKNRHKRT